MRPFVRLALLVLSLSIPAGVVRAQAAVAPPATQPAQLTAPDSVGRYRRGEMHDFGSRELGVSYQYRNPDDAATRLTLYLYGRDSVGRAASDADESRRQAVSFRASLDLYVQRGEYETYEIVDARPDSIETAAGVLPGAKVVASLRIKGRDYATYCIIYLVGDAIIKIRATVPVEQAETSDVVRFASDVVKAAVVK